MDIIECDVKLRASLISNSFTAVQDSEEKKIKFQSHDISLKGRMT